MLPAAAVAANGGQRRQQKFCSSLEEGAFSRSRPLQVEQTVIRHHSSPCFIRMFKLLNLFFFKYFTWISCSFVSNDGNFY